MLLETAIQKVKLTKWTGFTLKLLITLAVIALAFDQVLEHCSLSVLQQYWGAVVTMKSGFGLGLCLLSFWNWGTEAKKWQLILPTKIAFWQALKSVLVGLGVSAFMPRVAGESIGRYTSHSGNKKEVVTGLILSKILQTSVTLVMGLIGFIYFFDQVSEWLTLDLRFLVLFVFVLGVLVFIYKKQLIDTAYLLPILSLRLVVLIRLYLWTLFRYCSFVGQVVAIVVLLGIDVSLVDLVFALMLMYGIRLATISLNVAVDLAIRFSTAILILQQLQVLTNVNEVIAVFTWVWVVNVIIPTLIGGILISTNR